MAPKVSLQVTLILINDRVDFDELRARTFYSSNESSNSKF